MLRAKAKRGGSTRPVAINVTKCYTELGVAGHPGPAPRAQTQPPVGWRVSGETEAGAKGLRATSPSNSSGSYNGQN